MPNKRELITIIVFFIVIGLFEYDNFVVLFFSKKQYRFYTLWNYSFYIPIVIEIQTIDA